VNLRTSRRLCCLLLLAWPVSAGPDEDELALRKAFYAGDGNGPYTYRVCRFAAMVAPMLSRAPKAVEEKLVWRLQVFADQTAHTKGASRSIEAQWAVQEAKVFQERLRYRRKREPSRVLREAAKEIARIGGWSKEHAAAGYVRAMDLMRENGRREGADAAHAIEGMRYMESKLSTAPAAMRVAAHAATQVEHAYVLISVKELGQAKKIAYATKTSVEASLRARRDPFLRSRFNDLVTLSRALGMGKPEYSMLERPCADDALWIGIPVSRAWTMVELDAEEFTIMVRAPDGRLVRRIRFETFDWDKEYGDGRGKPVNGKNVIGLARMAFEKDRAGLVKGAEIKRPKKTKLSQSVKTAQIYEVAGYLKTDLYRGVHAAYFRTSKNTVSVRMEDTEPRGRRPDPALDAFFASFALER